MKNRRTHEKSTDIIGKNVFSTIEWLENITVLDLSNRGISDFDENIRLPPDLIDLNLSHNKLTEVPVSVLTLDNLKTLNLSYNNIVLFDETPNFCHTIESLDLLSNKLEGPPYWVWTQTPKNLVKLDLSYNYNICQSLTDYYFEELLQYTTLVKFISIHNCSLSKYMKLLSTFRHAKVLNLGSAENRYFSINHIVNVPCVGLEDCCDIEVLNLCETNIYTVQHNIDMYQNLKEINLSQNYINSLPDEFCNLTNLEVCILSFNKLLYLPDDMHKLGKLIELHLDNNELCMIPASLDQLEHLKILDLYNNHLYEGIGNINNLEQYDFAQNYDDEPNDEEYSEKKEKLRKRFHGRLDGRAPELVHEESYNESDVSNSVYDEDNTEEATERQESQEVQNSRCSSPEDWDSDDYWIPSHIDISQKSTPLYNRRGSSSTTHMQWINYVKRKMAEGNFCPMDMHLSISITEKVRYEKLQNPQPEYESDGQFDDYSGDES